jgi:hypothetical protein
MEDEEFPCDKIFCQQCGLAMVMNSYEIQNENTQSEMIIIKLKCKNYSHKLITEINFEDYYESIKKKYNDFFQCKFCNSIFQQNIKYCIHCNSIICEKCYDLNSKTHNNTLPQRYLNNKCFLHINDDKQILYYCIICKREMCEICVNLDKEHFQNNKIEDIIKLQNFVKNQSDMTKIKTENESLLKRVKVLQNKINFNEILLKEFDNNNDLMFSNINKPINIIYLDSSFKKNGSYKNNILRESQKFEYKTKGNIILTDDISNFNLLLKHISKN